MNETLRVINREKTGNFSAKDTIDNLNFSLPEFLVTKGSVGEAGIGCPNLIRLRQPSPEAATPMFGSGGACRLTLT
jgi:hypothetical protein